MDKKPYIQRHLLKQLRKHLKKDKISLVVGPRQTGKTTLMRTLLEELIAQGEKTLFLSLDFESDRPFFTSQRALVSRLELEFGKAHGYVFIDEIQRKSDAGIFLKGLYDMQLPYKFIVSGSGSLELKEKIHESLAGRKRLFELFPVSLEEFLHFKTAYRYTGKLTQYASLEQEHFELLLQEYLNFGGYPEVILAETMEEKISAINEIYRSYMEKDISALLQVEKADAVDMLAKLLAGQVGSLVQYNELSRSSGVSLPTLKTYLWYLEKTFILERVQPYFRNPRSEIVKSPVVYFTDIGLRNYLVGMFGTLSQQKDFGFVFENLLFQTLKQKIAATSSRVRFWRTKDKAEVDFVVGMEKQAIPVEVKYKHFSSPRIERSLHNFIKKYSPKTAYIVNRSYDATIHISDTTIRFIPIASFIEQKEL